MDARQFEAVLDCVFDCVVTLDGAGKIGATNLATQETFGYTREELQGKDLKELVHGGVDDLLTGTQRKTPRRQGYVGCRYDGSLFPLELALTRVDHAGEPLTVVTLRDVSEYTSHTDINEGFDDAPLSRQDELEALVHEKTRDIERERATIELLLSVAYCANYSTSLREALAATLELLCNHLGWELGHAASFDACSGTFAANELWFGPWPQTLIEAHRTSALATAAVRNRAPVVLTDRTLVDEAPLTLAGMANGLALPILVGNEVVAVLEAYALDPSEAEHSPVALAKLIVAQLGLVAQREEREHELRTAAAVAEAATRQKSEFLSNMSHEFRTPMHAIINYTNLALRGVDRTEPERLKHYLNNVSVSSRRLLAMLNDILDLAKMDSGRFQCE
ncbi:MAG TPA: histidine kinase dimerization/phospho-acceptor domain-containing protein, partial [Polyangiaceae bacterium]|nr:histidine kinase dimerization/phospho-acceptor domain-containing protein [Polyangiaceae bacterium]